MGRLVWVLGWIAIAIWSLVAWISYGLLDVVGGFATRNADRVIDYPEGVEFLSWAFSALQGLGGFAIVAVWALVSLAMLAATAILARILGAVTGRPHAVPGPYGRGPYTIHEDGRPYTPHGSERRDRVPSAVREIMQRIERR
jgi:hypothetical protein